MPNSGYGAAAASVETKEETQPKRKKRRSPFTLLLDFELAVTVALVMAFIVPQLFGFVPDVVMSASMQPAVEAGSVAYIDTNIPADDMGTGDIAVYRMGDDKQVMHRIEGVHGSEYTFKGDANKDADAGTVDASRIVGRYMFHIPEIGYAYMFFDQNRVAIIVIIVALNLVVYLLSERARKREEREEEEREKRMREEVERLVAARTAVPYAHTAAMGNPGAYRPMAPQGTQPAMARPHVPMGAQATSAQTTMQLPRQGYTAVFNQQEG